MATYPLILTPDFSYEDHLMYNQYISDVNQGLSKVALDIARSQIASAAIINTTLNDNAEYLANTITAQSISLGADIQELRESIEYGLAEVADGIAGLRSDFDIAMGKVLCQFEMMRSEMQEGLNQIIDILNNRRKMDAQEHFRDALAFYQDGCRFPDKPQWFIDALKHFKASVDSYERNPIAHLHIAHIYHFQKEELDFDSALKHYTLCYTYGEAKKRDFPIAAQGYFYAGWLSAAIYQKIEDAIRLTEKSLELDTNLSESHYNLAKFHSILGNPDQAVKHLKKAIIDHDREYCLKAGSDPDFNNVRDEVNLLFANLRDKARAEFEEILSSVNFGFDPKDRDQLKVLSELKAQIELVRQANTYFGYLDNYALANEMVAKAREAARARTQHYEKAIECIREFEDFIEDKICLHEAVYRDTIIFIKKLKIMLAEPSHEIHDEVVGLLRDYFDQIRDGNPIKTIHPVQRTKFFSQFKLTGKGEIEAKDKESEQSFPWIYYWVTSEDNDWLKSQLQPWTQSASSTSASYEKFAAGMCTKCGKKLGFFEKLQGKIVCRKCEF